MILPSRHRQILLVDGDHGEMEDAVVGCLQRTGLSKPGAVSFKLKDISSEFLVFPWTCVRTRKA